MIPSLNTHMAELFFRLSQLDDLEAAIAKKADDPEHSINPCAIALERDISSAVHKLAQQNISRIEQEISDMRARCEQLNLKFQGRKITLDTPSGVPSRKTNIAEFFFRRAQLEDFEEALATEKQGVLNTPVFSELYWGLNGLRLREITVIQEDTISMGTRCYYLADQFKNPLLKKNFTVQSFSGTNNSIKPPVATPNPLIEQPPSVVNLQPGATTRAQIEQPPSVVNLQPGATPSAQIEQPPSVVNLQPGATPNPLIEQPGEGTSLQPVSGPKGASQLITDVHGGSVLKGGRLILRKPKQQSVGDKFSISHESFLEQVEALYGTLQDVNKNQVTVEQARESIGGFKMKFYLTGKNGMTMLERLDMHITGESDNMPVLQKLFIEFALYGFVKMIQAKGCETAEKAYQTILQCEGLFVRYQKFLVVAKDNGYIHSKAVALAAVGLIFDELKMERPNALRHFPSKPKTGSPKKES